MHMHACMFASMYACMFACMRARVRPCVRFNDIMCARACGRCRRVCISHMYAWDGVMCACVLAYMYAFGAGMQACLHVCI